MRKLYILTRITEIYPDGYRSCMIRDVLPDSENSDTSPSSSAILAPGAADPNVDEQVATRVDEFRAQHHIVTTLAELRRSAAMTQTEVARRWGRAQSRVSSLEADVTRPEMSTLMEYVHALGGHLEIRVTVNDHTYIEQLV